MRIELSIEEFEADPMNYIEGAASVLVKDGGVRSLLNTSDRLGKICGKLSLGAEYDPNRKGWLVRPIPR